MSKFDYSHNNFKAGELGPKLKGDISKESYYSGCEEVLNMFPQVQGGLTRRPGTRYQKTLVGNTVGVRLFDFVFSKSDAYSVAIDDTTDTSQFTFTITRNDGTDCTVSLGLSYNIGLDKPGTDDTDGVYGVLNKDGLQFVQQGDQMIFVHKSGRMRPFIINRLSDTQFEITKWGRGRITNVNPLHVRDTVGNSCSVQAYKDLPNFPDQFITIPFTIPNADPERRLRVTKGPGNFYTFTFVGSTDTDQIEGIWNFHDIDDHFKITIGGASFIFELDLINTAGLCNGDALDMLGKVFVNGSGATDLDTILAATGNTVVIDNYQFQAWSANRGWPRAVTLHQQRLVFGGTIIEPDYIWHSGLGNIYRFMERHLPQDITSDVSGINYVGTTNTDDPFSYPLSSSTVDVISYLDTGDSALEAGTVGAEFTVTGYDNQALSNASINIQRPTSDGSSPVQPVRVGKALYFVSADGKKIREFAVSAQSRRHETKEITEDNDTISHHLLGAVEKEEYQNLYDFEFIDMAYSESRNTIFFLTKPARALVSCTLTKSGTGMRYAWARHTLGGEYLGGPVIIDGLCVLPSPDGTSDEIWLSTRRTNDLDQVSVTLEKIGRNFNHIRFKSSIGVLPTEEKDIPVYVDCAFVLTDTVAKDNWTFPSSASERTMRGAALRILANGYNHRKISLVPGSGVTLDYEVKETVIGFPFKYRVKTMPLETGMPSGQSSGSMKRIDQVVIRLYKSFLGHIGLSDDKLIPVKYDNYTMGLENDVPEPFSGNKEIKLESNSNIDAQIILEGDHALPFTVLNLTARGMTND